MASLLLDDAVSPIVGPHPSVSSAPCALPLPAEDVVPEATEAPVEEPAAGAVIERAIDVVAAVEPAAGEEEAIKPVVAAVAAAVFAVEVEPNAAEVEPTVEEDIPDVDAGADAGADADAGEGSVYAGVWVDFHSRRSLLRDGLVCHACVFASECCVIVVVV